MDSLRYDERPKKPSLNSVIDRKNRAYEAAQIAENAIRPHDVMKPQPELTDTEKRIMDDVAGMSVQAHLEELRKRIIICIVVVLVFTCGAYYFAEDILHVLTAPAGKLYYMRPTEAFFTYMKVAFFSGLILSSPILIYQVWAFVVPALTRGEKTVSDWFIPIAVGLFWGGIAFAYFFVLPAAIQFFIGFGTEDLQPLFSVGQYLEFIIAFLLPFGAVFELPLVVLVLAHFNWISSSMLKKNRKYFIFLAFVIGAVISPTPDMFSQTMIALPMIILYEISLVMVKVALKK